MVDEVVGEQFVEQVEVAAALNLFRVSPYDGLSLGARVAQCGSLSISGHNHGAAVNLPLVQVAIRLGCVVQRVRRRLGVHQVRGRQTEQLETGPQ